IVLLHISAIAQPTWNYTGAPQSWVVPAGVHQVSFDVFGAEGGEVGPKTAPVGNTTPGKGARIQGMLTVVPGSTLSIYVGGLGNDGTVAGAAGGWNGGGNASAHLAAYCGGAGGGGSDIRAGGIALVNRVVVAGGGGGAGYNGACATGDQPGGDGGGLSGTDAFTCLATLIAPPYSYTLAVTPTGGTQTAGGIGSAFANSAITYAPGNPGAAGQGGNTGLAAADPGIAGGGGGGYFGGGAGCFMGAAGGSSFGDGTLTSSVIMTPGVQSGNGKITICILSPGIIKGSTRLCTAQTIALTDSVGGGVWSSGNTAIATIDPVTGIATGVSAGIVNITYTVTSCTIMYAVFTINVTQSPLPITGKNPVCVGENVTFLDGTPGGYWTSTNKAAATIGSTSGYVSGIYPGSTTITYHDPSGGCFSTFKVDVDGIAGPLSVCNGLSIPLVSSTGGGSWTSSDTMVAKVGGSSVTGIVSGVGIGTASITYSSPVCPSHVTVTVNPVAPNAGADSICVNGTGYVTNIIGGGMWSSSDGTVAKVGTMTGLVTGMSAGTAVMSYLLPTGCLSQSMVEIIDLAPPITGFGAACPGNTSPLSDALADGIWSSLNTSVATVNSSGLVTAITADTVSIVYTIRPGCATTITFRVNPIPFPIVGRDTLCPGVMDTLTDASKGGSWTTSTPLLVDIVDSTGHLTTLKSGTATVKYTLPTGCYIEKNIHIRTLPVPVITYNPKTETFYTDMGFPKYQWYDSITGLIPHATSPSLAATYPQWYFVEITDGLGCKSRSALFYFPRQLEVKNIGSNAVIRMFPNPVNGMLNIESSVNVRAVISGVDGKIELQQANAKQMDLTNLASAVYFISLYDDSGQLLTVQKLVKQ
ncbi:MAG: surface protein, partial [Flavipsychrobacter sp.]|nr:surface protein [Flavipsychrobacter sp.]